jgi:hypothetical protein
MHHHLQLFFEIGSDLFLPMLDLNCDFPISAFQVSGTTWVNHWTWLFSNLLMLIGISFEGSK